MDTGVNGYVVQEFTGAQNACKKYVHLPFMFIKQPRPVPLFTMKFKFDLYKYVISQETV